MSSTKNHWTIYVIIHVLFIGIWGAVIEIPEKNGFPPTLGYVTWALTMVPAALTTLKLKNWKLDFNRKAVLWGSAVGILGAGGQLVLFFTLRVAPAYLVFPILSLTPVVTILLAVVLLHEKTSKKGWIGIVLALISIFMVSYQPVDTVHTGGYTWLLFSAVPLLAWGSQGCIMRFANEIMSAESLYFYMMISSIALIPLALWMTDFTQPIQWGFSGPYLSVILQSLNAIGALCLVYAFRYGKAIIIAPITTALAPVLTVTLSLALYQTIPHPVIIAGIVLTIIAALLMGSEEASNA